MDSSILIVLIILAGTVFMLTLDVVRIDVVAILSMLALDEYLPALNPITPTEFFID